MDIELYLNTSDERTVRKTVSLLATVSGTLRQSTSVTAPSIVLEYDLTDNALMNYCRIPAFGRWYFINDITSVRTGLLQIDCRCDVLMTYAEYIYRQEAIIRRNESVYNLYLNDGSIASYQNPHVLKYTFPSGFDDPALVLVVASQITLPPTP